MLHKSFDSRLLSLATTVNSPVILSSDALFVNPSKTIKNFILDLKIQIDRLDLITQYLYIHPDSSNLLAYFLPDVFNYKSIWGISIIETNLIPIDNVLATYEGE